MDVGTFVFCFVTLIFLGMLTFLFMWLMEGWISPGIPMIISAVCVALLFTVFGWILLIALAVISSAIAGMFMASGGE